MTNQNFYFDFLIDLKADRAEFDPSSAAKILGDKVVRFTSGMDLLLRYTNTTDRVELLNAIGNCIDSGTPIDCFYRWDSPDDETKALEVRAEFIAPHQLVGVIIDQTINTARLFPPITLSHVGTVRSEAYFLISRDGAFLQKSANDIPVEKEQLLIEGAKKFLAGNPLQLRQDIQYFHLPDTHEAVLCICSDHHPHPLLNELEQLLERFRVQL